MWVTAVYVRLYSTALWWTNSWTTYSPLALFMTYMTYSERLECVCALTSLGPLWHHRKRSGQYAVEHGVIEVELIRISLPPWDHARNSTGPARLSFIEPITLLVIGWKTKPNNIKCCSRIFRAWLSYMICNQYKPCLPSSLVYRPPSLLLLTLLVSL